MLKLKGEFQNNFLKIFKGTVLGQLIPIAVSPIISRLYSPNEIGLFAFYSSIITIGINVICLKFDQAIVLPAKDTEADRLYIIAIKTSKIISLMSILFLVIAKIGAFFHLVEDFSWWWFLLGIHLYMLGVFQSCTYLLNRYKLYSTIGKSKVHNGIAYAAFQILFFKLNEFGLVLSLLVSRIFTSYYLKANLKKNDLLIVEDKLEVIKFTNSEKALVKKYRDFPLYSSTNSLLNSSSNQLPILLLNKFYSAHVTGIYSWGNRIIQTPMGFVTSSIQQVFYQEVASRVSDGKSIYNLVVKTYKKLFVIGLLPYTIMFLFAPAIFSFVFGKEWQEAGYYTRYLIPWLFIVFMNSPITSIVPILGKQRIYFINESVLFVLRAIALGAGYYIWNKPEISVLLYGLVGFLYNVFLLFYLMKFAKDGKD